MRIILDLSILQGEKKYSYIGRLTLSITKAILNNRKDDEIFLIFSDITSNLINEVRLEFDGLISPDNIKICSLLKKNSAFNIDTNRKLANEILWQDFIVKLQPDHVHFFSVFEYSEIFLSFKKLYPNITTSAMFYDALPLIAPEEYLINNECKATYHEKMDSTKKCDIFFTISDEAHYEAINYAKIPEQKVVNIPVAVDNVFKVENIPSTDAKSFLKPFRITKSFIIYSGNLDEFKNVRNMILAFSRLKRSIRKNHQLMITYCSNQELIKGYKQFALDCGISQKDIRFIKCVGKKELAKLYNLCELFILQSIRNGGEIALHEALNCGTATICGNNYLSYAIKFDEALFDHNDVDKLTSKIESVLADDEFFIKTKQYKARRSLSFDDVAEDMLVEFKKLNKKNEYHDINIDTVLDKLAQRVNLSCGDVDIAKLAECVEYNFSTRGDKPTLFIDISELVKNDIETGVQRVTKNILIELLNLQSDNFNVEPIYATLSSEGYRYAKNYFAKIKGLAGVYEEYIVDVKKDDIFIGLDLCHEVILHNRNHLHFIKNMGAKLYFIVYDLLPITLPCYFYEWVPEVHNRWLKLVSEFDGAIAISKSVRQDLANWRQNNNIKTHSTYVTSYFYLSGAIAGELSTRGIPENSEKTLSLLRQNLTILMVSTLEPRKAHHMALKAIKVLWGKGYDVNFVMVGKKGWNVDDFIKSVQNCSEYGRKLFWLNNVTDEYLSQIYEASSVVLMASYGEGFGLSIVEAANHGKPVIVRDIPIFREVAGGNAHYFKSDEDLADSIISWIALFNDKKHPVTKEINVLTWKESAAMLIKQLPINHS